MMFIQKEEFAVSQYPTAFIASTFRPTENKQQFEVDAFWVARVRRRTRVQYGVVNIFLNEVPLMPFVYANLFDTTDFVTGRNAQYSWNGDKGSSNPEMTQSGYNWSRISNPDSHMIELQDLLEQLPEVPVRADGWYYQVKGNR
jgi:hypothetical protein